MAGATSVEDSDFIVAAEILSGLVSELSIYVLI